MGKCAVLYECYEWQRQALQPVFDLSAWMMQPAETIVPIQRALQELGLRLARSGEPVEADLGDFVRLDVRGPLDVQAHAEGPFATCWRFRSSGGAPAPVVFVPPCSGYVAGITSPLIVRLVSHRPVLALDWTDARQVPKGEGSFHLADQIAVVEAVVRRAGPGAVVLGLSQSVTAAVAGAALAARAGAKPAALVLLAGPFDTSVGVHPLSSLLRLHRRTSLENQFTSIVPHRFPGAGRRVYPGLLQLWAYTLANPSLYVESTFGLFNELAAGEPGLREREHRDLHSLADVPAEIFIDTIEAVYRQNALATGRLQANGRRIDLEALAGVQLLTVEMTADELVGRGHTHAAVDHVPHGGARRLTVEGGQHHEVFTGERFFSAVAPHLDDFLEAA